MSDNVQLISHVSQKRERDGRGQVRLVFLWSYSYEIECEKLFYNALERIFFDCEHFVESDNKSIFTSCFINNGHNGEGKRWEIVAEELWNDAAERKEIWKDFVN